MKKEWIALMKGSGITLMIPFFFLFSMNFTVLTAQVGVNKNVTLKASQQRLEQVLEKLAKQTFLHFYCNEAIKDTKVSASVENASLAETMRALLQNTGLQYSIQDGNVIIVRIPAKNKKLSLLKGYITDMNKKPIPGATLFVKTAGVGAATDITGTFTFSAPIPYGSLITVSFIGMKTRNIVYGGEESIRIFLEEDVHELESVIVTGFQTISRERSTGAANIIKKDYLEKIQSPNLGSKLEGITPGLTSYNGNMSIRGISSFAVNSTPLLVLDGQPITGVSINDLNPDDIESITVLKDAAATSLYGVRASNGVIVVTTKRGTTQKATISLSAGFYIDPLPSLSYQHYASTSDIIDYEQQYLLNNPTYLENPLQYFESMNRMESPQPFTQIDRLYYNLAQGKISQEQLNTQIQALRSKDYRKEYRNALQQMKFTQNYNMNISQSGDYSNLFFSARFEDMGSHNKQYNADKFSFYLKNELNLTKWFKFTYGTNVSILNSQAEDYNSEAKANQYATRPMPYESLYHEDGSLSYWYPTNYDLSQKLAATEGLNGLQYNAIEESNKNLIDTDDLYWKLFAHTDMQLLKGLDLGLKFQYENRRINKEQYDEADSYYMRHKINQFAVTNPKGGYNYYIPQGGHMAETHANWRYLNFRAQLNYQTVISEKHDITALVGGEIREDNYRSTNAERYGYDEQKLTYSQVDWATLQQGVIGQLTNNKISFSERVGVSDSKHRYVSGYFNVGYTYDSRYAFNGSMRMEQADLFGTDPKYRYRPLWSVGASWNLSNEGFMNDYTLIDLLKLRLTYGLTGNVDQNSSPYLLGTYITSPYSGSNLTSIQNPPNRLLRWEKTSSVNVGVDFTLFKKFSGSLDFYNRYSSDLLANKSLDPSVGFTQARVNNGAMRNTGVEMNFTYDWISNRDWTFTTTLTAAYNKNKIEKVGYLPTDALNMIQSPQNYYLKGDTYNSLYAYRYAGLTEEGNPSIYNKAGEIISIEPVRDIEALVCSGQLDPKWNGALDLSLRWKSLSFFTKLVYYTGHSLRRDATPLYNGLGSVTQQGSIHEDLANRWTPENTNSDIPNMLVYGLQGDRGYHWKYADYQVVNASFMKVRNIGLAYTLPNEWLGKSGFRNISLRAQVNNPIRWAANKEDIDPEAFNANYGTRTSAQTTSYILGININF